jgi:hypothetical protein
MVRRPAKAAVSNHEAEAFPRGNFGASPFETRFFEALLRVRSTRSYARVPRNDHHPNTSSNARFSATSRSCIVTGKPKSTRLVTP